MEKLQAIKLKEALRIMDEEDSLEKKKTFSIAFYPSSKKFQDFKRISIPEAVRCGLPRQHQSSKDLVGVSPLIAGRHNYSVPTRLIVELNGIPVIP
jgi:hypothetical protein